MRKGSKRVDNIYEIIKSNPGIKPYQIANRLGITSDAVKCALPGLETNGYLTFETEDGTLYPFNANDLDNSFWLP
jgi:predicted ArsR family transcriptional regulator